MPTPVQVTLTLEQMRIADDEGRARNAAVMARNGISQGPSRDPIGQNIVGVMGELAFSTWSGLPWTASRGARYSAATGDVGTVEVRTRRRNTNRQIFIKNRKFGIQHPSTFYVLTWADVDDPVVDLVGWTSLGAIADYGIESRHDTTAFPTDLLLSMEVFPCHAT